MRQKNIKNETDQAQIDLLRQRIAKLESGQTQLSEMQELSQEDLKRLQKTVYDLLERLIPVLLDKRP